LPTVDKRSLNIKHTLNIAQIILFLHRMQFLLTKNGEKAKTAM